ncbi:MAG: WecB/TagA/CpsF family glycosyltransferase, partial [Rhodobacteraceae bacterium]|nr:WecB/TagA/CpsF family glycosyltransferase [Paracoccaceae bacterium]
SPRQEAWVARNRHRLRANVLQGVGGTFDVLAGAVKRAPPAWIRLHLEWLYRLVVQPARISRQWPLFRFALLVLAGRLSPHPLPAPDDG